MFKKKSGAPLKFSLLPCKERGRVRNIIEKHGGQLTSVCKRVDVRLTNTIETSDEDHIHINFVLQSDAKGNLLEMENFSVKNMRQSSTQRQRTVLNYNQQGRHQYSKDDDEKILDYLQQCARSGIPCYTAGNALWKKMEQEKVTDHSWQSMRHHYLHKLKPAYQQPKNPITQRMHMGQLVLLADPGHSVAGKSKQGLKDDVHQHPASLSLPQIVLPTKEISPLSITASGDQHPARPRRKRAERDQPLRLRPSLPRRAKASSSPHMDHGLPEPLELNRSPKEVKQGASSRLSALKRTWRRRRGMFSDFQGLPSSSGKQPVSLSDNAQNQSMADDALGDLPGPSRSPRPPDNISKDEPCRPGIHNKGDLRGLSRLRPRLSLQKAEETLQAFKEEVGVQESDKETLVAECKAGIGRWKLRSQTKSVKRGKRTLESNGTLAHESSESGVMCDAAKVMRRSRRNRTVSATKGITGGIDSRNEDRPPVLTKKGLPFEQHDPAENTISTAAVPLGDTDNSKRRSVKRAVDRYNTSTTSNVNEMDHGKAPGNSSPSADGSTATATLRTSEKHNGHVLSNPPETLVTDGISIPDTPGRLGTWQGMETGDLRQGLFRMKTGPTVGDLPRIQTAEQEDTNLFDENIEKQRSLPGLWTKLTQLKENPSMPLEDLIAVEVLMENGVWDRCRNDSSTPPKTRNSVYRMEGELTLKPCAANFETNQSQEAKGPTVLTEKKETRKAKKRKKPVESKRRDRSSKRGKTDKDGEPEARTRSDVGDEPVASAISDLADEPVEKTRSEVDDEPVARAKSGVDDESVARTESAVDNEPVAETKSKVDYKPATRTKSGVDDEPEARIRSDVDDDPVARARSDVNDETVARARSDVNEKTVARTWSELDEELVARTRSNAEELRLAKTASAQTLVLDSGSGSGSVRETLREECAGQTSSGDKDANAENATSSASTLNVEHHESPIPETEEVGQIRKREELVLRDSKALIISIFGVEAFESAFHSGCADLEVEGLEHRAMSRATPTSNSTLVNAAVSLETCSVASLDLHHRASAGNTLNTNDTLSASSLETGFASPTPRHHALAAIKGPVITAANSTIFAAVENTTIAYSCQSARTNSTVLDVPKSAICAYRNDLDNEGRFLTRAADAFRSTSSPSSDQSDAYYSAEDLCRVGEQICNDFACSDQAVSEESL